MYWALLSIGGGIHSITKREKEKNFVPDIAYFGSGEAQFPEVRQVRFW
jgi:radical SAM superfamily enzyme YgiQ (UPF0313 family)